jgi:hypothetical protein
LALAQLHPRRRGTGDRAREARALLNQLGHERDLGVERGAELGDETAQEGAPDDARGAGGEPAEEVAFTCREDVDRHWDRAMLTRLNRVA